MLAPFLATSRVAVLGLGLMGGVMARNLIEAGFRVTGYDLDPQKVAAFTAIGGQKSEDPGAMAAQVDVIMLSLPKSHVVDDVVQQTLRLQGDRRNVCSTANDSALKLVWLIPGILPAVLSGCPGAMKMAHVAVASHCVVAPCTDPSV